MSKNQYIDLKMFAACDATVSQTMLKHMQLSSRSCIPLSWKEKGWGREEKSKVVKTFPADVQ